VHNKSFKVDIELDSIVFAPLKNLLIFVYSFLLKKYVSLILRSPLSLKFRTTIHLLCQVEGGQLFLILIKRRVSEAGFVLIIEIIKIVILHLIEQNQCRYFAFVIFLIVVFVGKILASHAHLLCYCVIINRNRQIKSVSAFLG
jgi:hypothetical protein